MKTKTRDRIAQLLKEARDIAAAAEAGDGTLSAEDQEAITRKLAEVTELKSSAGVLDALAKFADDVEDIDPDADGKLSVIRGAKSLGDAIVGAEAWKAWVQSNAKAGEISKAGLKNAPAVPFEGLKAFGVYPSGQKAPVQGAPDTSAGALIPAADYIGLADEGTWMRPLTLLDVVTRGTTGLDIVEFARGTTVTNAAAPVAEATATGDASGTKPESAIAWEKVQSPVRNIAHWVPATNRALADAGQVRTLIDNFLRYGLFEELEDQIVSGDGTGENFTGILTDANVQTQAWVNGTGTNSDPVNLLYTLRAAKTKAQTVGRVNPNGVAMNPADVERLDLLTDSNGNFYFGGPNSTGNGPRSVWRVPIVETEAVPANTAIMGDWRRAVLWDREAATITASDSHADFFVRNLVAILGELRAAFGITRPEAFVEIDITIGI